jgi:DNA topoisomerase-1
VEGGGCIRLEDGAKAAARAAQLRYVSDRKPGIARQRDGAAFRYRHAGGRAVRDAETLDRIRRLAIPPAWEGVWICADPNGHIQAVGRDARGRKQYRYHARWRAVRDEAKFERMVEFARTLPLMRARVAIDIGRAGMPREKVLATVVRLLETTLIRVGNDEYAKQNGSYGLTTLRNRHASIRGRKLVFDFKGKSGVKHRIDLEDARLARIVKDCQELPGRELFTYLTEDGEVRSIGSCEVNEYLRAIAGEDVTAKDFRSWAATILAAIAFETFPPAAGERALKRNVRQATAAVAEMLGNTPAVCRKCYIHPAIVEGYMAGTLTPALAAGVAPVPGLKPEEAAVMAFLAGAAAQPVRREPRARRRGAPTRLGDRPAH